MASTVASYMTSTSANFGDVSAMLAQHWVRKELTTLRPSLVFATIPKDSGENCWLLTPVRAGYKVHFYRLPQLAASTTAITEDAADPAAVTGSLTGVTATVAMYGGHQIIPAPGDGRTVASIFSVAMKTMMERAALSFDTLVRDEIYSAGSTRAAAVGNTAASTASITSAATNYLTLTELAEMAHVFATGDVYQFPNTGAWKYIAYPTTIKTLRAATATSDYAYMATNLGKKEALEDWSIGRLMGFDLFESTRVTSAETSAATSALAYKNVAAGYESVGVVALAGEIQPPKELIKSRRTQPELISNVDLIVHGFTEGGAENPLNRRGSVAYVMHTVAKVLEAARVYTHWCGAGKHA